MELKTSSLGKVVKFELEFYGKDIQLKEYIGVIDSVLIDTNLGMYGYSVNYINDFNRTCNINFIDKKIIGENHIGENLEKLKIIYKINSK